MAVALLCCSTFAVSAQEEKALSIVVADSTWGKEIIPFPIEWAPDLTIEGFEELRFAPQWDNTTHQEFWSLVMSWNVKADTALTLEQLRFNLEGYFDGLMKPNHWAETFEEPKAKFFDLIAKDSSFVFKGEMSFFDGFHTGKPMTIHILGEQLICEKTGRSIVIFKFSPRKHEDPIWEILNSIEAKTTICDE